MTIINMGGDHRVTFSINNQGDFMINLNAAGDLPSTLKRITVMVNDLPVIGIPLYWHEFSRRLHTVCDRENDDIEEVEL